MLSWRDNRLEFSAPHVHFLGGKPLELLHNAAPVPFDFQVTLWSRHPRPLFARSFGPVRGQLRSVGGKVQGGQDAVAGGQVEHLTRPRRRRGAWTRWR